MSTSAKRTRSHRRDTLFKKIGEVSVTWAYLELAVDMCIETIHFGWGGAQANLEIPRTSFFRKLTYLRDWFASDPKYQIIFPNFENIVQMLEDASEHRHRIIHGVALNIDDFPKTGKAELTRTIRRKNKRLERRLPTMAKNLALFLLRSADFSQRSP